MAFRQITGSGTHTATIQKQLRVSVSLLFLVFVIFLCGWLTQKASAQSTSGTASSSSSSSSSTPYLMSLNRPVYASSVKDGNTPDLAIDGSMDTRWETVWQKDPQWMYVDLGARANITRVVVNWENAYATAYEIQVSDDERTWTPVYSTTTNNTLANDLSIAPGTYGRYVRLYATKRTAVNYGYSVYEFSIYGTGGANPPPSAVVPNIALNAPVTASSDESQQAGSTITPPNYLPSNIVDGSVDTRWSSIYNDKQWIYVDLGKSVTIGSVVLKWQTAYGRAYDIDVSDDASNWTTVYRQLNGSGGTESVPLYATGRYVRMNGIARGSSYGYSLLEFEVYPYVTGGAQPVYPIPAVTSPSAVQVGSGSFEINDITQLEPPPPIFKTANITGPVPSNDWWQSLLIANMGNGNRLISLPLRSQYTKQGLAITRLEGGYASPDGGSIDSEAPPDLYLAPNTINPASATVKVDGYGDYSVRAVMSDDATAKMMTTLVQGSPFVYNTFASPDKVQATTYALARAFDDGGNPVLVNDFDVYTGDHIGIELATSVSAPTTQPVTHWYGIFAPPGSTFMKIGSTIKITLGNGQTYLSLAAMTSATDLSYFYQHAYAFVTDTKVDYTYNPGSALVTTNFNTTTALMRSGFSSDTVTGLLPHQWKLSSTTLNGLIYPSVRGVIKLHEGNSFTTVNRFNGVLPQFATPTSPGYSPARVEAYLDLLDQNLSNGVMNMDPYWQGKALHPLAEAVLIADQLGDVSRRDGYLAQLKTILTNWFTYSSTEPVHSYYFHYSPAWGTIFPYASGFGVNTGITDHHFTYGYFTFASAVLASYDNDFLTNYGGMVEMLLRDYANPSRTDKNFPMFRNFNPYEGHSWAGGFADNRSGNNQEAAGEALFSWVGEYLWGTVTGNNTYRDAGIYGFTTEEKSVEQYWFNFDQDNWATGFNHASTGQVYGSAYLFGTYFGGDPEYVYGIHWLPTSEWLTYYGRDPAKAAMLYKGLTTDIGQPEREWQHVIWPFQTLSDPAGVLAKFDPSLVQQNELFNSYWFIYSMAGLGQRSPEIWSGDWPTATIYKKGNVYTAQVWNPTNDTKTVTFQNASGVTGSTTIPSHTIGAVDPTKVTVVPKTVAGSDPYLDRTGWTATAFYNSGTANMLDNDLTTRWTSTQPQAPGQWLIVDMKAVKSFDTVFVNAGGSGGDYPHGYQVFVSQDGSNWGDAVVTGNDTSANIAVIFPAVQSARYIKVMITGSSSNWWSVAEIKVAKFGNAGTAASSGSTTPAVLGALDRAGWVATAFGASYRDPAPHMLDGDPTTIWSSGQPQAPGQWVQIDMGKMQTFDNVVLDAGGRNGDYPRSFDLFVSADGSSWGDPVITQSATGLRQSVSFAAQTARYIRIVQKGSASNWWSIGELIVAYNGTGPVTPMTPAGWVLTASSTGGSDVLANMLDGNSATRWTNGVTQAAGQWLQIDLGSSQTVKQVDLDSASNDYPRGYQAFVSADGVNWGSAVSSGSGTTPYVSIPLGSQKARYIKILLTAPASSWWSVAEMSILN